MSALLGIFLQQSCMGTLFCLIFQFRLTSLEQLMEKYSQSSREPDENEDSQSPTITYLLDKTYPLPIRKVSVDSETDRQNFCLNFKNNHYTVLRVYINAMSSQSTQLYYTKFTPSEKLGQICIIHGYGQCTDDYLPTAQFFAKKGYIVHMVDLRGHGYSGGDRVNEHVSNVMLDVQTLLVQCCERGLSTFILTQGLGSIFINSLLQQNRELPISGVIQISPLIRFIEFSTLGAHWRKFLLYVSPFIFGNLLVHNKINPTALAKSPLAIKAKIENVFFQSFITLKMAADYDDVAQKASKQAYKFGYPCLMCYGSQDHIQKFSEVKKYFKKISSLDKELKVFDGAYHEMHLDEDANEVREYIYEWMKERTGQIKWKRPKSLDVQNLSRKYFWQYIFYFLGLLILMLKFSNSFKKVSSLLWRIITSFLSKLKRTHH